MRFQTYTPAREGIDRQWFVIDATDMNLGRLATRIAHILRGKHKATFSPHMDTGDCVIVLNAGKITVTGNRLTDKFYYRHSQFPGGISSVMLKDMISAHPERALEIAVKGMLPHNRLGHKMFNKLYVYAGTNHPHEAQKPVVLDVPEARKVVEND
jgi:large subunit ribosomal protein L13